MRTRADLVFQGAKIAVFVDGCFWHSCPLHATAPNANASWWREKLKQNRLRDRRVDAQLKEAGWRVIRVWEHEDPAEAADRIERMVRSSSSRGTELA
jgi:DNA mismatch endonuclease (patch repair protein)